MPQPVHPSPPENHPPDGAVRLLDEAAIQARIHTLAEEIGSFFQGQEFLLVGILKGSVHFASDLARALQRDPPLEWIRVRTYPSGTSPQGDSEILEVGNYSLKNRIVLVLDDVLDRGQTHQALTGYFQSRQPARVHWCFLLAKRGLGEKMGIQPDFTGFTVPDRWLIGYGLDLDERYRNLRDIYALPDAQARPPG
ncbi:MAG: Hypoxanthine-guanine phosphoribosyltransferase [bacterium]|nr:hypoxanthine phosphoribosyltransferase [bacterium]MBV6480763.1 Hypoxanthine-guanine phosphoribosyltransferase [bacterium]